MKEREILLKSEDHLRDISYEAAGLTGEHAGTDDAHIGRLRAEQAGREVA